MTRVFVDGLFAADVIGLSSATYAGALSLPSARAAVPTVMPIRVGVGGRIDGLIPEHNAAGVEAFEPGHEAPRRF